MGNSNNLFSERSSEIFINSTLALVDDALYFLREDNDDLIPHRRGIDPAMFAQEFRTIHVRCRRRMGHTNLINQLAYNFSSPIGSKYSTLIITPQRVMADQMYGIHAAYFTPEDQYETSRDYASIYNNYMRSIPSHVHFDYGKIATAEQVSRSGFKSAEFITQNKETMSHLMKKDISDDKIDLLLIDVAGMLSKDDINNIYMHFSNSVEVFLFLE